ncbi:MAG: glycosyltransferase family 1 protein [Actinomycetes bacterium]
MRVAISAESFLPRTNGVANSVAQVARQLAKHKIPTLIIAPDSYEKDHFEGTPVHRVRSFEIPGVHDVDIAFPSTNSLEKVLWDFQPTVAHLASPMVLGRQVLHAAQNLDIPSVAIFQTHISGYADHYKLGTVSFLADNVIRGIHKQATLNLAPSQYAREYLESIEVRAVELWGRGVDREKFSPSLRSELLRLNYAPNKPLVGFVGRLAPEKNISILTNLSRQNNLKVVVIGDGPDRLDLMRAMPDAVFAGRLHDAELATAIASLDVLVASGELETFCQVIQEGMASGVPVVAPFIGGPRDLIQHEQTGMFYEPGNQQDMERQVQRLLSESELRNQIIHNGLLQVAERSWEKLTIDLMRHYRRVSHRSGLRESA